MTAADPAGSSTTDAHAWLDARRPPPPAPLRSAIDTALDRAGGRDEDPRAPVADRLADAGLAALGRVAGEASERTTAPQLLAADALITYACEAAAEAGPDALDRLLTRLDTARFSTLLPTTG